MDICGNCGAPLDLNEDGECRWCRAKAQARHSRSFASGSRPALNWKWSRRVAAIAAIAMALAGQPGHVYVGTVTSVGPALVLAQPGDPVTIRILDTGARESTATMQSFTDTKVPLQAPGS